MNVIVMVLAILYSDHCEFGGEKTECQGAEEGGALERELEELCASHQQELERIGSRSVCY